MYECGFDEFFEHRIGHLEICLFRVDLNLQFLGGASAALFRRELEPIVSGLFSDKILVLGAPPVGCEVNRLGDIAFLVLLLNDQCAEYFLGHVTDHRLQELHHGFVIAESLVGLEHGELRVMPARDAFVAEVAADLKYSINAANQ